MGQKPIVPMGSKARNPLTTAGFLVGATVDVESPTTLLTWKTDEPVCVDQWCLSNEKLKALESLVEE